MVDFIAIRAQIVCVTTMENQKRIINIGKRITKYGNVKRAKVAAIALAKNGNIIAFAHNRRLDGDTTQWTQHAEEALVAKLEKIKAFDRFDDITVFVMRVNKSGISMAKPCRRCEKLLSSKKVKILYTDWNSCIQEM